MMPGPLLVVTIGQTAAQGFRAVIGLMTGHALIELLIVALLMAGLRAAVQRPRVRGTIGLVGGAALLWMAWDMLTSAHVTTLELNAEADAAYSWPKLLLWGAAISMANPYFTGWWATIGAGQLAHIAPRTAVEYLSFYLGHETSDFAWYSVVGLAIITGRGWLLANTGVYHGLIYTCGAIIGLLGLWFVWAGGRFLAGKVQTELAGGAGLCRRQSN